MHRSPYDDLSREPQGKPKLDANGEVVRDKLGNIVFEEPEASASGSNATNTEQTRAERKALKAKLAAAKKNKADNATTAPADGSDESEEEVSAVDNRASGKSVKISDLGKEPQAMSRRERLAVPICYVKYL